MSVLHYQIIPVTAFAQNCSLLWCDATREAAVIDPGGDLPRIEQAAQALGLKPGQIWLTHGHIDHAGGAAELAEQSRLFGLPPARAFTPTRWLHDGDTVQLGHCELAVRHCPGHTPGHVIFHSPEARLAFVGDVLFAGSVGRTDFPQGSHAQLIDSITRQLWPLGDDTAFVPGHGPGSTFGHERRHNPFVRGT